MLHKLLISSVVLLIAVLTPSAALGWDVYYDGGVVPTDQSLGNNSWYWYGSRFDPSYCSVDDGILHFTTPQGYPDMGYGRSGIHGAVTAETRVRVASGMAMFSVGTDETTTFLSIYPDRIETQFVYGSSLASSVDMTAFRTIRVATTPGGSSYVWLDGALIAQGTTNVGGQLPISFGMRNQVSGDSYWDYVAYSNAFVPVPEPSSLAALGIGLLPLAGVAVRRRRRA